MVLEGPWNDRFGPSLDVAIEHSVPTHRRFRRIAETTEEKEQPDGIDCGSKTFLCFSDIVSAILAIPGEDNQQAPQKRKRGKTYQISRLGTRHRGRLSTNSCFTCTSVASRVGVDLPTTAIGTPCHYQHMASPSEPGVPRAWVGLTLMSSSLSRLHV